MTYSISQQLSGDAVDRFFQGIKHFDASNDHLELRLDPCGHYYPALAQKPRGVQWFISLFWKPKHQRLATISQYMVNFIQEHASEIQAKMKDEPLLCIKAVLKKNKKLANRVDDVWKDVIAAGDHLEKSQEIEKNPEELALVDIASVNRSTETQLFHTINELSTEACIQAKKDAIDQIHHMVKALQIHGLRQMEIKDEVIEMWNNLLFPLDFTGKLIVQSIKNGFEISIPTSTVIVGEFPNNSRVPYDLTIEPKDGLVTIQMVADQSEIHLYVSPHLMLHRVSDATIEKIIESLPNFPFFVRRAAREQLLLTIYDPMIAYKEFVFFSKPSTADKKVLIKVELDPPTNEAQIRSRKEAKINLGFNLSKEFYARSAINWGKMMMFPELGADASLINKLFRVKKNPLDENGRVTWKKKE